MVDCRNCGKSLEGAANFCPYCRTPTRMPYQPMPAYAPPRRDKNVFVIVIVVVVVFFVLQFVLAGVLYIMVMGFGTPAVTTVTLTAGSPSADRIDFTVTAVSSEIYLTSVWINIRSDQTNGGMTAGYGFPEGSNIAKTGIDSLWLSYNDRDGDRMLSIGDTVTMSSMLGPLPSGTYTVDLDNGYGGPMMGSASYTMY